MEMVTFLWYVLCDFLRPCVESIAPWLYVEDKNDPFIWKMLYVKLRKISLFKKGHHKFTHLKFDSREVDLTTDVKFFDSYSSLRNQLW
uniref:Uncharacterized protein n=1 Tax=Arion vulgaris TaxID=1028688 RepID=A0A0B7AAU7_9EUPU